MTHDADILIVGGGLNGPAMALALAQSGFTVTIVDSLPAETRDADSFDGRAYALALASKRLLDAIGVWARVEDNAQPMLDIVVSDGRAGEGPSPLFLHFDHTEIEEGPMGFMLEDRFLRQAFLAAMAEDDRITQVNERTVTGQEISASGVSVTLDTGETLSATLLIGSDGRQSGVAQRAGIKRTGWQYGQTAITCAIRHEKPHEGTAHQFFMPHGPLAILPLPGNMSSIVWSETDAQAREFMALSDEDFTEVLRPRFGSFLGDIEQASPRFAYPLNLTIANRFIAERVALIGDAAHGMHPIAGQGLNAGLRDVGALAQVLKAARQRGDDIAAPLVLKSYEEWRRFDTHAMIAATDLTNKLFSNDNPILRAARDLGLGAVNAIAPLRRSFMREAAGLTGELPELMR